MQIQIKRVYEEPSDRDGNRILIDRLWPRGLTKENAKVDVWLKEIAPSTELRQWFNHDENKWAEFTKRYRGELRENPVVKTLIDEIKKGKVTLVYGAKDEKHNNAVALREYLLSKSTK